MVGVFVGAAVSVVVGVTVGGDWVEVTVGGRGLASSAGATVAGEVPLASEAARLQLRDNRDNRTSRNIGFFMICSIVY
jgi:hypothetical protein